jgi:hypothetical protein
MSQLLLDDAEVKELTGVRIGRNGKTRAQLQEAVLKRMRIPCTINAANRVIVARAVIEGQRAATLPTPAWEPGQQP